MTEINIDEVVENCKKYRMRMLELEMRMKEVRRLLSKLLVNRNSPVYDEILELLEVSE
jgi:hypothetical protein